jgi:hypothetical protein
MRIPHSAFWLLNSGFWILNYIFWLLPLRGDIIDRIAITVANQVITESQIDDEIRLTAFLNRERADLSAPSRKTAAGRLIEQALTRREMELSHYPLPNVRDAATSLASVKAMYPSETDFESALKSYGITLDDLNRRLLWQLTLLRFIDYRFRPGIQIPPSDVQAYYRQQVSEWQQKGINPIPTLDESRNRIEDILTEKRIDQALDQWLQDSRKQVPIRYLDPALQ